MKTIFRALLACLLWISTVAAQTPFYEGKTVRIIVGFSPGGSYDLWPALWLITGVNSFLEARTSWCRTLLGRDRSGVLWQ